MKNSREDIKKGLYDINMTGGMTIDYNDNKTQYDKSKQQISNRLSNFVLIKMYLKILSKLPNKL